MMHNQRPDRATQKFNAWIGNRNSGWISRQRKRSDHNLNGPKQQPQRSRVFK